jgi:hypothetical protein
LIIDLWIEQRVKEELGSQSDTCVSLLEIDRTVDHEIEKGEIRKGYSLSITLNCLLKSLILNFWALASS